MFGSTAARNGGGETLVSDGWKRSNGRETLTKNNGTKREEGGRKGTHVDVQRSKEHERETKRTGLRRVRLKFEMLPRCKDVSTSERRKSAVTE